MILEAYYDGKILQARLERALARRANRRWERGWKRRKGMRKRSGVRIGGVFRFRWVLYRYVHVRYVSM